MPSKSTRRMLQRNRKDDATFSQIVQLIASSREKALQAVNTALIDHYWEVGANISRKIAAAGWVMRSWNSLRHTSPARNRDYVV